MGGVEERGFLKGSDRTGQECAAGSAPRPACLAAVPRGALAAPPAMPHFTVVPVEDKHRAEYDSVEGLSWVDYREPAAAPAAADAYDTVSSDGERGRGAAGTAALGRPGASPAAPLPSATAGRGRQRRRCRSGSRGRRGAPRPEEEPPRGLPGRRRLRWCQGRARCRGEARGEPGPGMSLAPAGGPGGWSRLVAAQPAELRRVPSGCGWPGCPLARSGGADTGGSAPGVRSAPQPLVYNPEWSGAGAGRRVLSLLPQTAVSRGDKSTWVEIRSHIFSASLPK